MQDKGLSEIKQKISVKKDYLLKTYGVEKIGIFGSFARNEATKESDLDVVVSLKEPISYFKFFNLEKDLGSFAGISIDLATEESLKAPIKDSIMRDLVLI